MRGRFITFEGGEGVGKSTQARHLAARLEALGKTVILTREPGGSPGAEEIRTLLMQGSDNRWTSGAEALLFSAARADHVAKTIRPALEAGHWVICDRYIDSMLAYQSGASGIARDDIMVLHKVGSDGLMPCRTLLMTLDSTVTKARLDQRDQGKTDRFGGRGEAFHRKVEDAFLALANEDPSRIRKIDAQGSELDVTNRLFSAIEDMI